jgi:hypothetical protein
MKKRKKQKIESKKKKSFSLHVLGNYRQRFQWRALRQIPMASTRDWVGNCWTRGQWRAVVQKVIANHSTRVCPKLKLNHFRFLNWCWGEINIIPRVTHIFDIFALFRTGISTTLSLYSEHKSLPTPHPNAVTATTKVYHQSHHHHHFIFQFFIFNINALINYKKNI